jgi:hypothetical protein
VRDLKSFVGRLLLVANVVVAVAAALAWLLLYLAPETFSVPAHAERGVFRVAVREETVADVLALLALGLLLGDFLWLLYGSTPKSPPQHILSEAPGGPVKISRDALEAGLRTAGEDLEEISRLRVAVQPVGKQRRIGLRAQFQAPDGVSIQAASEKLRRTLRTRFADLVHVSEGTRLDIDVEFLGFSGRPAKKPPAEPPAPTPAPEPESFTGPRYPIDDDEDPYGSRNVP